MQTSGEMFSGILNQHLTCSYYDTNSNKPQPIIQITIGAGGYFQLSLLFPNPIPTTNHFTIRVVIFCPLTLFRNTKGRIFRPPQAENIYVTNGLDRDEKKLEFCQISHCDNFIRWSTLDAPRSARMAIVGIWHQDTWCTFRCNPGYIWAVWWRIWWQGWCKNRMSCWSGGTIRYFPSINCIQNNSFDRRGIYVIMSIR